jgi:segregation and condensation protein B
MTQQEMQSALEAIIYAADEPATLDQLCSALGAEKVEVRAALDLLVASHSTDERGIEIRKVAGGWKFYTKPQHHEVVRRFIKSLQPPIRLTMPALETLAVVAYKQPVTVPEINEIRGVNVGGVIKTLLEKRLITTAGRKEVIGRPILYRTSKQFLMRFGLSDLEELPSLKEFEQLAQAALGSDAGVAPVEPPGSEAPAEAQDQAGAAASVSEGLNVAPNRPEKRGDFSSASPAEAGAVPGAAAREEAIESASLDMFGEQADEAFADSKSTDADSPSDLESARAAKAGGTNTEQS